MTWLLDRPVGGVRVALGDPHERVLLERDGADQPLLLWVGELPSGGQAVRDGDGGLAEQPKPVGELGGAELGVQTGTVHSGEEVVELHRQRFGHRLRERFVAALADTVHE
jgi:hypothetical protein